jgi:hypothetical protein
VVFAEPAAFEAGLSSLLKFGTENGATHKLWIASCLAGGVGLAADCTYASKSASNTSTMILFIVWCRNTQERSLRWMLLP